MSFCGGGKRCSLRCEQRGEEGSFAQGPCTANSRRTAVRLGGTWPSSCDINAVPVARTPLRCLGARIDSTLSPKEGKWHQPRRRRLQLRSVLQRRRLQRSVLLRRRPLRSVLLRRRPLRSVLLRRRPQRSVLQRRRPQRSV